MPLVVSLNGTDISTHRIFPTGVPEGWLDTPPGQFPTYPLSGRTGAIVGDLEVQERRLSLPIRIDQDTPENREISERWVKGHFGADVVVQILDGSAVRQLRGVVEGVALRPVARLLSPVSEGALRILAGDPCWQEVSATDLSISGETVIQLGSAPVRHWSLAVEGALTDVTVVIKDGDGNTLWTLAWVGSMTTETLTIDSANGLVMLDASNEFANYTGGFPELRPATEPTITVTAASGSPTATLSLRRRWW